MSNQWEVVGKKKDKSNKEANQKIEQAVNKKKAENLNVKVEDVLAKSQVKNLYSIDKNKENKPFEVKKVSDVGSRKTQKKQEKSNEVPKPKAPKTIESALGQIDVSEFRNILEKSRSQFPEAPIVWLKELAQFLNQKINVEVQEPSFANKPQSFPLTAVPAEVKSIFEKAFEGIDENTMQLFFDISLASMATDMSKGLPAIGHKLFLQYIALNKPNLVTANLAKHSILRTSYQNRPNIGVSILWAVGQTRIKDFQAGITVLQDFMLPLIEQKNYSKYIFKYLIDLIMSPEQANLTKEQHLFILEKIFSNKKNFPNELRQDLLAILPRLKSHMFYECKKDTYKDLLDVYLKKIVNVENVLYQENLCDVVFECFVRDQNTLEYWAKIYSKNINSSVILLKYLEHHWQSFCNDLNKKMLLQSLQQIASCNRELMLKKKKYEGLDDSTHITQRLLKKMTKKKSHSSIKFLFLTSCLVFSGLIYYDVKQQGSWQKSKVNTFFKESGVCAYTQQLFHGIQHVLLMVDEQIEQNFPTYKKAVAEFSEPYIELSVNLGRLFRNIYINIKDVVLEQYPIVLQSIEAYAPGLMEHSQNAVNNVWSSSVFYYNRSIDYLRKEIFVGQLSPENVQKVMFEAFNTTQNKATEYYHWLYEKVQSTIS